MGANALLGLISLILAGSPYVSQITSVNEYFRLRAIGNIRGSFEIFVISLGVTGFAFSLYNMFLRKKNGSPYIVIGVLVILVGFFYNEETIPLPLNNTLLGGELFFAFVVSFVLAMSGLVVEWLIEQPN